MQKQLLDTVAANTASAGLLNKDPFAMTTGERREAAMQTHIRNQNKELNEQTGRIEEMAVGMSQLRDQVKDLQGQLKVKMVDLEDSAKRIAALQDAKLRSDKEADEAAVLRDQYKSELEDAKARYNG